MKIRGYKYYIFLLVTLVGVFGYNLVPSNTVHTLKPATSFSSTTDNFQNQFSEEKHQNKKTELVQGEVLVETICPVKKLDSDEYFIFSTFFSTCHTSFQGSKLSINKFYSFIPILDSLYIIYCVYRL